MRFAIEYRSDLLRVLRNKIGVSETMSRSDLCLGSNIVCQTTRTIICVICDRFFLPSDKGKFRISQCRIFMLITPIRRADFTTCSSTPIGTSTMPALFRKRSMTVKCSANRGFSGNQDAIYFQSIDCSLALKMRTTSLKLITLTVHF